MENKLEIRISVRDLVEFILRSGDIDNRRLGAPENAMLEGGRIHRMLQRQMGPEYEPEVFLRYRYESESYVLIIEGRADGIITEESVTIDEIKAFFMIMQGHIRYNHRSIYGILIASITSTKETVALFKTKDIVIFFVFSF